MLLDRVSNPGPLTYESGAPPIALRGPANNAMLHQVLLFLGQLWQLFEVSQILEFLRYCQEIKQARKYNRFDHHHDGNIVILVSVFSSNIIFESEYPKKRSKTILWSVSYSV